jgi:signal transduction histidine kinase
MRGLPNPFDARDLQTAAWQGETPLRIVAALLTTDLEQRRRRFEHAASHDPRLVLWAVSRAAAAGCSEVTSVAQLAGWLAELPVAEFQGLFDLTSALPNAQAAVLSEALLTELQSTSAAPDHRDQSADDSAALLAELVERLARLESLESRFDGALETAKLDALKELAYGAGHEINNPLANISARAQTLLHAEHDPDRRRMLAAINTQAFRAHEMIADMMLFARPPQPKLERIDLSALVTKLSEDLKAVAREQGTSWNLQRPESPVWIDADATQIAVAVRAVCVNALEALVQGGAVELALSLVTPGVDPPRRDGQLAGDAHGNRQSSAQLSTSPADFDSNRQDVQITVSDSGRGISPAVRQHIFDPFYSGREAGRGLGFGLPKCWRIVQLHGGRITVDSSPLGGARLTIWLSSSERF